MKSYQRPALYCKNADSKGDSHEIQIPFSNLLSIQPYQIATAKDAPAVNVACPHCKHVYGYTREDVRQHLFQIPDQYPVPSEPISFFVEFVCDDSDCESRVILRTMRAAGESKPSVIDRLRQSVFHIACGNNHVVHFPKDLNLIVRAEDDGPYNPF
jgi:hypothetical protein